MFIARLSQSAYALVAARVHTKLKYMLQKIENGGFQVCTDSHRRTWNTDINSGLLDMGSSFIWAA